MQQKEMEQICMNTLGCSLYKARGIVLKFVKLHYKGEKRLLEKFEVTYDAQGRIVIKYQVKDRNPQKVTL